MNQFINWKMMVKNFLILLIAYFSLYWQIVETDREHGIREGLPCNKGPWSESTIPTLLPGKHLSPQLASGLSNLPAQFPATVHLWQALASKQLARKLRPAHSTALGHDRLWWRGAPRCMSVWLFEWQVTQGAVGRSVCSGLTRVISPSSHRKKAC